MTTMIELTPDLGGPGNGPRVPAEATVFREEGTSLGLKIMGGTDADPFPGRDDRGIYISRFVEGSLAEICAFFNCWDRIVRVNDVDFSDISHEDATTYLKNTVGELHFHLMRRVPTDGAHAGTLNGQASDSPPVTEFEEEEGEVIEVSRVNGSFGMSLVGGTDSPSIPFGVPAGSGIYVSQVRAGGGADQAGTIRMGDRIIEVDGEDVQGRTHASAISMLVSAGDTVTLMIQHPPPPAGLATVEVYVSGDDTLGISVKEGVDCELGHTCEADNEVGIFITEIEEGSVASKCAELHVGQRLMTVSGRSVLRATVAEARSFLEAAEGPIKLMICDGFDSSPASKENAPPEAYVSVVVESEAGHVEVVEVARVDGSFGMVVVGGSDTEHHPFAPDGSTGIYISRLRVGGGAEQTGCIFGGDELLEVDGVDMKDKMHSDAIAALKNAGETVKLKVRHTPYLWS